MAPTREKAHAAFERFLETCQAKYPKASECLQKDRAELLAFYDFPAEHWVHLRTTHPIDSAFATIRHRLAKVIAGVRFVDGVEQSKEKLSSAAA